MPSHWLNPAMPLRAPDAPSAALDARQAKAVAAIEKGGLAVVPTETVYAVLGKASDARAIDQLAKLQDDASRALAELLGGAPRGAVASTGGTRPWTWHAASAEDVLRVFALRPAAHRRVVRTLLPGPVRMLIETTEAERERVCKVLGVSRGVLDHDGLFAVRVPNHPTCLGVLAACPFTVVGTNSRSIGLSVDSGGDLVDDAEHAAQQLGIQGLIDEGPTQFRKRSASVRLMQDGDWRVEAIGAVDERWIRKQVEYSVLVVCTGNTCRSPMAQAIAQHEIGEGALGEAQHIPVRVESAGVAASPGAPMTREAREALEELGIEADRHSARMVTRDMVREADAIFALTRSHAQRLIDLMPDAKNKVRLLDPKGQDVPDPFGGTQEQYLACATTLRDLVQQRVREMAKKLAE
jgi:protein-tyrosine phosphatase